MTLLFVAAALTGAWGCGSGGDSTSSLTKKQFLAKADKFCEEGEKEQLELASKYLQQHPGAEEEEMILPAGLPPLQKQTEKIKALPAPEGDEAEVETMIEAFEKGLKETKANPQDLMTSGSNPFTEADKLAEKYGLNTSCSSAP